MKISIDKNEKHIKLHISRDEKAKRPSIEVWLKYDYDSNSLGSVENLQNWCLTDSSITVRRFYDLLYIYLEAYPPIELRMDVDKFIKMLLKLPRTEQWTEQDEYPLSMDVKFHPGIGTVVIDTDKFRMKHQERVIHSWVKIGKWCTKGCITNIINAHKIGLSAELKPILSGMVGKAEVYPDWGSGYSFTFDGRKMGLGYNGGIICHGIGEATFSVELNPSNKPHYSVHT